MKMSEQDEKIRELLDRRRDVMEFVRVNQKELDECNKKL